MLYWGLPEYLGIVVIFLYALSSYLAYSITRLTSGAPTAWYVVIVAFVLTILRRGVELYFDVQAAPSSSTTEQGLMSVVVASLFVLGLYMLAQTFRRQLRAAQAGQAVQAVA